MSAGGVGNLKDDDDGGKDGGGGGEEEEGRVLLALQLAIPYMLVGDLGPLAAVSRSCRAAALASYQSRLNSSSSTTSTSNMMLKADKDTMKPIMILQGNANNNNNNNNNSNSNTKLPTSYRMGNPWSHLDYMTRHSSLQPDNGKRCLSGVIFTCPWEEEETAVSSWRIKWRTPGSLLLQWQEGILHCPDELGPIDGILVVHSSFRRGGSILLIATKKFSINGTEHELDPHDDDHWHEDMGLVKHMWCLLYDVSATAAHNNKDILRPVLIQRLTDDPKPIEWSANYEYVNFGHATWSGNGKVVAVVTAKPSGEEVRGEVTVFDVTEDRGLVQRCTVSIGNLKVFTNNEYNHKINLSLNTVGEFLSILNQEGSGIEGIWTVHDVRGTNSKRSVWSRWFGTDVVLHPDYPEHAYTWQMSHAYFTPDNDFVMLIPHTWFRCSSPTERKSNSFPRFARQFICHILES